MLMKVIIALAVLFLSLSALATGTINTFAGNGVVTFGGDGGLATEASLRFPGGMAVDEAGNLYIADAVNHRIRKVDRASGIISTVAGNGSAVFSGDGGVATAAGLSLPQDVVLDSEGNFYIADSLRIRLVDKDSGIITTVAGNSFSGFSGDGGSAISASFSNIEGIALDDVGNLYIADSTNNRIRRVDAISGIITTVAGNGLFISGGDGRVATLASLSTPESIAFDSAGNLYIAEKDGHRIRKVDRVSGIISTVAGSGSPGFSGDGGLATAANLSNPSDILVDEDNNLYIVARNNHRIRKVDQASGIISTVAGNGSTGFSGDGGVATNANLDSPEGIARDIKGNIYVTSHSSRVRVIEKVTRNNFDTDADSDLLLRNTVTGLWRLFSFKNLDLNVAGGEGVGLFNNLNFVHQVNADFDGDGDADVLLRRSTDNRWRVFEMQDRTIVSNSSMSLFLNPLWQFQAAFDFDKDGDDDILQRRSDTGQWRIFEIEDLDVVSSTEVFIFKNGEWELKGVADYDGDGDGDVLLRRNTTGQWRLFEIENQALVGNSNIALFNGLQWDYITSGDMDNSGVADILLRRADGSWRLFEIADNAVVDSAPLALFSNLAWQHAQAGDYDGDGDVDILLRRTDNGLWRFFEIEIGRTQNNSQVNIWSNQNFEVQH